MKHLTSIFGIGGSVKAHDAHHLPKLSNDFSFSCGALDTKSTTYFRTQNFDRNRFSYNVLTEMSWWPDEAMRFIDILTIAYNEFINIYRSESLLFDTSIRNAIYFMNQSQYSNQPDINAFVTHGDYNIANNYLSVVIREDNCYMREVDEHKRSPNEYKHYLLARALEKLLTLTPISDGELSFKKEYEETVRLYVIIYNLKNMYAVTDDALRSALVAALTPGVGCMNLYITFKDLLVDFDARILHHLRECRFDSLSSATDEHIFSQVHIYGDLLLYAHHATTSFHYTFNFKRDSEAIPERLTPSIDATTRTRIEYVYRYYYTLVKRRATKDSIIQRITKFEDIITKTNDIDTKIITPRYIRQDDNVKVSNEEKEKPSLFIVTLASKKGKRLPHPRKASMDVLLLRSLSPRTDTSNIEAFK